MLVVGVITFVCLFYLFQRLTAAITKSSTCLVGKTAIVTGGNTGIGYQVALNLACRGCKVIIADKDNAEASCRRIIEETSNPNVIAKHLDLASLTSVREFAENIKITEKRLDILINNAGVGASSNQYTPDGLHPLMQTNCFGHFLLTHLLIDLLKQSTPSRIIFTSSMMAYTHNLKLENINFPKGHSNSLLTQSLIFSNANMCNILIADGFARKLQGLKVTSNSVHPGATRTEIFIRSFKLINLNPIVIGLSNFLMLLFGKSAWEGAQTTIHVVVAKELENVSGCHFWDCLIFPKPLLARNLKFQEKLWGKIEDLVQLSPNEKI